MLPGDICKGGRCYLVISGRVVDMLPGINGEVISFQ